MFACDLSSRSFEIGVLRLNGLCRLPSAFTNWITCTFSLACSFVWPRKVRDTGNSAVGNMRYGAIWWCTCFPALRLERRKICVVIAECSSRCLASQKPPYSDGLRNWNPMHHLLPCILILSKSLINTEYLSCTKAVCAVRSRYSCLGRLHIFAWIFFQCARHLFNLNKCENVFVRQLLMFDKFPAGA